jgi:catechol 2,3-dioxygenase-like lactoylglutathione lyase family enzyme
LGGVALKKIHEGRMGQILGLLLPVTNTEVMSRFFCNVLDFEKVDETILKGNAFEKFYGLPGDEAKFVILRLGREYVYLFESVKVKGRPYPANVRSHDHIFQHMAIVVSNMEDAYRKLLAHGIEPISEGPQTIPEWNTAAAGIRACYFRSPEQHPLELIYFPMGKGKENWQKKRSPFLGIDHTAITVSQTENSLRFYQGILGIKEGMSTVNYGVTQEKLSGLVDVKVKITSLAHQQQEGMGLEFLHYLFPLDGRPISPDLRANDLMSVCTVIEQEDLTLLKSRLSQKHISLISQGVFYAHFLNVSQDAFIFKDPDGHRLLFVEKSIKE